MEFKKDKSPGFTLIELIMVIVLIGIVAATAVMVVGNVITQQQFDATVKEMNELKMSNLGNPDMVQGGMRTSFAFVGDIGGLPAGNSLQPLVVQGGLPNWATTTAYHAATYPAEPAMPDLGTGAGWKGPYIDNKRDDSGTYLATLDGWGNAYTYVTATGLVTSTGGGAGNIVIPETSVASQLTGGVTGTVRGNQGNPVEGAIVRIYYPNGAGAHAVSQTTTAADGTYSLANVPIGRRTIRIISGISPNWVIMNDTVVVDGNQTVTKNMTIADMVAPNPPTAPAASRASYTSLNLTWTASTSPDVLNYKIYRGTAPGGEVLYRSGIVGASYSDDNGGTGLIAGTTYYYELSAVDTAGNESTLTAEFNETVNPIQQVGLATRGTVNPGGCAGCPGGSRQSVDLIVSNNDLSNITVDFMRVTWTVGGGQLRRIDSPIGTNRYCANPGATTGNLINVTNFTINAGVNRTVRLYFCTAILPDNITVEFNPSTFDGSFLVAF